jgi:sulfide dehydrogenase cytochrome subunit
VGGAWRTAAAAACLFACVAAASAAPAVPPPGAASCTGCHASNPKVETRVPRIAGRSPAEIVAAMEAFRSGQKPATVMDRIAKGFTEAEVRAIAAWLGAQR